MLNNRAKVIFTCQLDSPSLAFLHAHNVLQQPLLPTAVLLELAAAANAMLNPASRADNDDAGGGSAALLQAVVFAAPHLLAQAGDLTCSVSMDTGVVEVQSSSNSSNSVKRLHMAATLAHAPAATAAAAEMPSFTPSTSGTSSSPGSASFLKALLASPDNASLLSALQPMGCVAAAGTSDSITCGGVLADNSTSDGFVLHPATLEAALQVQALQVDTGNSGASSAAVVAAPATIKAVQLPARAAAPHQQCLQISAMLGVVQPQLQPATGAAARLSSSMPVSSSSMWLRSGHSTVSSLADAEFRPMQGSQPPAVAALAGAVRPTAAAGAAAATAGPVMGAAEVSLLVQRTVEAILGEPVSSDEPLMAAGLDSLGATEVRNSLAASLGLELPATLVSDDERRPQQHCARLQEVFDCLCFIMCLCADINRFFSLCAPALLLYHCPTCRSLMHPPPVPSPASSCNRSTLQQQQQQEQQLAGCCRGQQEAHSSGCCTSWAALSLHTACRSMLQVETGSALCHSGGGTWTARMLQLVPQQDLRCSPVLACSCLVLTSLTAQRLASAPWNQAQWTRSNACCLELLQRQCLLAVAAAAAAEAWRSQQACMSASAAMTTRCLPAMQAFLSAPSASLQHQQQWRLAGWRTYLDCR